MKFERHGSFWTAPLHRRMWLNLKHWFLAKEQFVLCLLDHQESIVENELTIGDVYHLCHSIQEARMGKTLKLVDDQSSNNSRKEVKT